MMLKKLIRLFSIVLLFALAGNVSADDIVFDANSSNSTDSSWSLSWTHTIGSGQNRTLIVGLAGEDNSDSDLMILSIKYNGVYLSPVVGSAITEGTGTKMKTELFYLLESDLPSSGSYTILATYSGEVTRICGGAISLANVAQQTAEAVDTNSIASGRDISTDITLGSSGMWVVDVVGGSNVGVFTTTGTDMVEQFNISSLASAGAGSTRSVTSAGTVTMSWYHPSISRMTHSVAAFAPVNLSKAANPNPPHMVSGVARDVELSWSSGQGADSHDVYFGTDFNDVNTADNSLPLGTSVYKGNQPLGDTTYDPYSILESEQTYYWRIDEVNDAGPTISRGNVWNFTVEQYLAADFTGDWMVNNKDLDVLTGDWLNSGPSVLADADLNGQVDFNDYSFLANEWEPIPPEMLITSFESGETPIWSGGTISTNYPSDGSRSYHVAQDGVATITLSNVDWSDFIHLKFDVYNPGEVMMLGVRVRDSSPKTNTAWEYNVYAGFTTQHVRIDGLRTNFFATDDIGIDTSSINRIEIDLRNRHFYDTTSEGLYIDNVRISTEPTEPYTAYPEDPEMAKPEGFYLPEFPGFEAGYHTWAIDPDDYQILAPPGSGHGGSGRALKFLPLGEAQDIKIWDANRKFILGGTYTVDYWLKGPSGGIFEDYGRYISIPMTGDWQHEQWQFSISAGQTKRFVMEARNLNGTPAWLDKYTVSRNGSTGSIEPVSTAVGDPTIVTWADGICYVNGQPTFMMGFMRSDPAVLNGTPFNFCFPQELIQPEMEFMDRCAQYDLLTCVNLTASMRSIAPESAAYFARKYKNHPALFSYYLCDEPDHASPSACSEPPVLARATQVIRTIDCNHPTQTTVIPWCASNIYRFRDATDMSGGDRYVVQGTPNNSDLWQVWRASEAFRRSARNGEVNIFVPRAQSDITREENWGQAYMCVVSAAGGILWFEFGGAQNKWSDFVELGNELRSIEHFLVGMELVQGLAFANDFDQLRGIGRAAVAQDQTALITVNIKPTTRNNVQITAPFLAHATQADVLFESRTVPVNSGVIVDNFAGLERHVYVVDGIPEGVQMRPVPQPPCAP
ncbi:MAG: hypothetical protein ACYS1A_08800 [Planctomycetota bacterium]|jgi:hypothetical protein